VNLNQGEKISSMTTKYPLGKALWVALLGAVFILIYLSRRYALDSLAINYFNDQKAHVFALYRDSPMPVMMGYVLIYVLSTALSIPIAVPMTLAGGMLFGFWGGTILVSISATTGATLSFLAARVFLRDILSRNYPEKVKLVNRLTEDHGAYFLFVARLVPIFPFFLMNLLLGLTSMKTTTYSWVSFVGMLAGTALYVNAGCQLNEISKINDLFSPGVISSLAVLALLPFLAKKVLKSFGKTKNIYP